MGIFKWLSGLFFLSWLTVIILRVGNTLVNNLLPYSAILAIISLLYDNKKDEEDNNGNDDTKDKKNKENSNDKDNNKDNNDKTDSNNKDGTEDKKDSYSKGVKAV